MGIMSERECVKRFQWTHQLWAKYQEYDYEELNNLVSELVGAFYVEQLSFTSHGRSYESKMYGDAQNLDNQTRDLQTIIKEN